MEGRPEVVGHRLQVNHERARVDREGLEPLERDARLVEEGREHAEGVRQRRVLGLKRGERAVGVLDQRAQLSLALVQRTEHDARVLDRLAQGDGLRVEHLQHGRPVLRESSEVAERAVQVLRRGAGDGLGRLLHPFRLRVFGASAGGEQPPGQQQERKGRKRTTHRSLLSRMDLTPYPFSITIRPPRECNGGVTCRRHTVPRRCAPAGR